MATFSPDMSTMATSSRQSRSRAQSVSSDRPSTTAHSLMSAPLSVNPEAAFVAASAASQIVTNDHDAHSETWYDQVGIEPSGETALVSTGALQLANNFIDHILFNIIGTAKSTRLADLRPAVAEVLKPKLASDAINNADEELREYLGGGDLEDLEPDAPAMSPRDWDLELAWKRTRLRCMVYSSLGDMEEEDEDFYTEQEHLRVDGNDKPSETVSPAVAIFLTSILEFMGEQVLVVSGQAAFNRLRLKYEKELRDGSRSPGEVADRIIVDELDMERVALDRTFGRLWRSWKKRIRTPSEQNFSRPFSRSSFRNGHLREDSSVAESVTSPTPANGEHTDEGASSENANNGNIIPTNPADIALPMSLLDVEEIEIPGLVYYSDDDELGDEDNYEFVQVPRPSSMIVWPVKRPSHESRQKPRRRSSSLPASVRRRPLVSKPEAGELDATREASTDVDETEQESMEKVPAEHHADAAAAVAAGDSVAAVAAAGVAAGVAAAGARKPVPKRSAADLPEELDEEPQIMTSSRVSVYGAPEGVMPSPVLPVRTSSIRSARIIDVPSRSPTTRSRNSSVDANANTTERSTSRGPAASSIKSPRMPTPPIAEEATTSKPGTTVTIIPDYNDVTQLAAPPKKARPPSKSTPPQQQPIALAPPINSGYSNSRIVDKEDRRSPASYHRKQHLPTLPERNVSRPVEQPPPIRTSPETIKSAPRQIASESPANKFRPFRSSEDHGSNGRPKDVALNFEDLIQSDQTLQYTLTPENMRDISASSTENSIGVGSKGRRSDEAKFVNRSRSSSMKRSMSVQKPNGLNSHPVSDAGAPRSSNPSPTKSRTGTGASGLARDARVPRESTQDFAAFIRGTGPPGEGGPSSRAGAGAYRQAPSPNERLDGGELDDFLRNGPSAGSGSNGRAQRAYEQSSSNLRTSQASTNITEASAPSSMNSSSALLGRNKPAAYSNNFDDDEMLPQRKQRRVRDPYAIDLSDEDEEEDFDDMPKPKVKPKQEESLIDFLKNYEPPPEPASKQVVPANLLKKRSASNLMARLRSNGHSSSGSVSGKQSGKTDTRPASKGTVPSKGYTPIQVNIPPNSDTLGNFLDSPSAPRTQSSSGRVPMKKFEPREAVSSTSRTNDLAAFLRDSEPPPSALAMPEPQQASGGMFRRKKF